MPLFLYFVQMFHIGTVNCKCIYLGANVKGESLPPNNLIIAMLYIYIYIYIYIYLHISYFVFIHIYIIYV